MPRKSTLTLSSRDWAAPVQAEIELPEVSIDPRTTPEAVGEAAAAALRSSLLPWLQSNMPRPVGSDGRAAAEAATEDVARAFAVRYTEAAREALNAHHRKVLGE